MNISNRAFVTVFLSVFFIFIGIVALTIAIIDPAFHFHAPIRGISYLLDKERYQNDGIVKHFDYDAVITGTSMVENSKTSEFDRLFDTNSVKVCFMGATYKEISDNINNALKNNPGIRIIMRSLDPQDLISEPDDHVSNKPELGFDFPTYLYDSDPFNDVEYVLNLKMLEYAAMDVTMTVSGQEGTSFDEYSNWNEEGVFSKESVLGNYTRPSKSPNKPFSQEDRRLVYDNINENVIDQANEYPDVEFYLWIPPYSICYYDIENQKGELGRLLDAMEYECELLTDVPNIKLYSFTDRFDIVTDLSLYKDQIHYREDINSMVIKAMKNGEGLIDKDNYKGYMKKVRDFYLNYDYESIYK